MGLRRRAFRWLQFEYNEHWKVRGATLKAAVLLLESHGYNVMLLDANGLHNLRLERYGEYFAYSNYVACLDSELDLVQSLIRDDM